MRPIFQWAVGDRTIELGRRTLIMGVLNVTPDSFSDGGQFFDPGRAVEHGLQLLEQGADILDVGGESTRPGAKVEAVANTTRSSGGTSHATVVKTAVSPEEELQRVLPVISKIKRARPDALISIDTYKATVARAAVEAGAEIVNDVSGLQWDPEMKKTVAGLPCGFILMHMRGTPETWRALPPVSDMVSLVKRELRDRVQQAELAGIKRKRIVVDPGIGFGKNLEQNYPLLNRLNELQDVRMPLLVGTSRKSFIAKALEKNGIRPEPQDRLYGSLAAMMISILKGAQIVRVHDVKAAADAITVADAILNSR
ncbi:MAG TPA: dihydropteroate synthase [Terriglobales bacterium]|nr:dihydropteroate synthase [Terriglobales bacterium]